MTGPSTTRPLAALAPAPPELLAARRLMRRVDTKFIASVASIPELIESIARDYAVVAVGTDNVATYENLYFDTHDLRCFHDHRRGRRIRHKIRIREYPDRQLAYLEVKNRRNELFTEKHRLEVSCGTKALDAGARAFLRDFCPFVDELAPKITIDYQRISLVGIAREERVTIDLGLTIDDHHGATSGFPGVAIIEVKQPAIALDTPIMRALRGRGLHAASMSKYVNAIALTTDYRSSRLRSALRGAQRITP